MKREKIFKSETELAEKVVLWLKSKGWEVYQEVTYYTIVADIVAVKDNKVWVIECKLSFGLQVLAQAWNWMNVANYISIAVPSIYRKSSIRSSSFIVELLQLLKIGALEIGKDYDWINKKEIYVRERVKAKELPNNNLIEFLHKEQKEWAKAGNNKGDRYTPFKHTIKQIEDYLQKYPNGVPLKQVIKNIKHHYSTDTCACNSIRQWINKGIIKNINIKLERGKYLYYYEKINK